MGVAAGRTSSCVQDDGADILANRDRLKPQETTMADSRAPITIFTFFLELRRSLPVPAGTLNVSWVPRDDSGRDGTIPMSPTRSRDPRCRRRPLASHPYRDALQADR